MIQGPTQSPPASVEWHLQETYKSLITLSVELLKILAVVNGGAAVAVLTYLGNLVARSPQQPAVHITPALLWYCGGLLATVFAFMFAYLVQLQLFNEEISIYEGRATQRKHQWLLWFAIALTLVAAVAFGIGCWKAASALGA